MQIGMACTLVVLSSMYFCGADWYFFVVQIGMACTLVVLSSMYFCGAGWYVLLWC